MVNRMSLKVNLNVQNNNWKPGLPLINDPKYGLSKLDQFHKEKILSDFSKYLAEKMKELLKRRIKIQYKYLRWAPLTPGYEEFKKKAGLSPNIWEATGLLVDSIIVYKRDNSFIIGVDPYAIYPESKVSVLFVAECMEFGTRFMPARPLFGPTITFMRRNVRKYWESFLESSVRGKVV